MAIKANKKEGVTEGYIRGNHKCPMCRDKYPFESLWAKIGGRLLFWECNHCGYDFYLRFDNAIRQIGLDFLKECYGLDEEEMNKKYKKFTDKRQKLVRNENGK